MLYGLFAALAFLWSGLAHGRTPLWDPLRLSGPRVAVALLLALAGALLVVEASRVMVRRWFWARRLHGWFSDVLGPLSGPEVLALALLSAIGEELLFRGAMQPSLGLWLTTLVFASLHFPPEPRLWPWTLFAALLGLFFGWLTEWSGSIAAAALGHFLVNALNLRRLGRKVARDPPGP